MNNKIFVFSAENRFKKFEKPVKKQAGEILKKIKTKNSAIEIFLIGNSRMRSINKKFKNKNKATNILTFVEPEKFPHPELKNGSKSFLGEIYLNFDQTKDYAKQKKFLSLDELLAHGFLHLMGYVHAKKNDRIKMEKQERAILKE